MKFVYLLERVSKSPVVIGAFSRLGKAVAAISRTVHPDAHYLVVELPLDHLAAEQCGGLHLFRSRTVWDSGGPDYFEWVAAEK
jgi:hypothetical protein